MNFVACSLLYPFTRSPLNIGDKIKLQSHFDQSWSGDYPRDPGITGIFYLWKRDVKDFEYMFKTTCSKLDFLRNPRDRISFDGTGLNQPWFWIDLTNSCSMDWGVKMIREVDPLSRGQVHGGGQSSVTTWWLKKRWKCGLREIFFETFLGLLNNTCIIKSKNICMLIFYSW